MNHIDRILKRYPFVVLDGGLATELEGMGYDLRNRLWSAAILLNKPDAILHVHKSYLEAGADCIITASYQATVPGFKASGLTEGESKELIRSSVKIAKRAVAEYLEGGSVADRPEPFVAASAGCYGAYLADGSEYNGEYRLSFKEYKDFHRGRLELLIEGGADFIAFETFPNIDEAVAVSELMKDYPDMFYWIVFTARDEQKISHGEFFRDCVRNLSAGGNLAALGINCSPPELISPLIIEANQLTDIPLAVYPNSGERFDTGCTCWKDESSKADFSHLAEEWYTCGARLIGGCCRTGPEDIRKISSFRKSLIR